MDTRALRDAVENMERSVVAIRALLPKVTRPRVEKDPVPGFDQVWRCVEDRVEWSCPDESGVWYPLDSVAHGSKHTVIAATPARIRLWASLLDNPLETVEDEG